MKELLITVVPLGSVVLGAVLGYIFTSRAKRDESIVRFKEEKYARLLLKLQGFIGITTSAQLKREFFEEEYQAWLYASDEVIESLNALVNLVKESQGSVPDPDVGRKAIGNVVLSMRRDLLGKTKLGFASFQYTDVHDNNEKKR
jgi:hypothetical protein